jgi:DNA-binding CsgD family transcriptional regulator
MPTLGSSLRQAGKKVRGSCVGAEDPHVFSHRLSRATEHSEQEWRSQLKPARQRIPRGSVARGQTPLATLFAAVEAIGAPVLVVGTGGEVLHANSNGRSLFERDPDGITRSFARSVAGGPNDGGWELFPLAPRNGSGRFLAILRPLPRPAVVSPRAASARWRLTARQGEVVDLVARGMTNANIAATLGIGEGTVEYHVASIFYKAGVQNRASLIARLHEL